MVLFIDVAGKYGRAIFLALLFYQGIGLIALFPETCLAEVLVVPDAPDEARSQDHCEDTPLLLRKEWIPREPQQKKAYQIPLLPTLDKYFLSPLLQLPPLIQDLGRKGETIVDSLHGSLSESILSTATWLDSFFGDERHDIEENQTYVRVRYDVFRERGAVTEYKPTVDSRLVLPQFQKKTHLVISGEPAVMPAGSAEPVGTPGERLARPEDQTLSASINYFFKSTAKESFLVKAGTQFQNGAPILFMGPRYRVLFPFTPWDLRFTEDVIWRSDQGWQSVSRFDYERTLPHELFFRTSAEGVWTQHVDGYLYGVSLLLRQPLDPKRALEYDAITSFQTRPISDLEEVAFRVRYRQQIWREWFFLEIAPQCRFPRSMHFQSTPGILFRLEMFFGRNA